MSAPAAISGPIERAGGVAAARLQLPSPEGQARSRGRTGGAALSTLPGRLLVLVPHVGSIDDGPEEACLRVQLVAVAPAFLDC